jgi:hypothetical protein
MAAERLAGASTARRMSVMVNVGFAGISMRTIAGLTALVMGRSSAAVAPAWRAIPFSEQFEEHVYEVLRARYSGVV